MLNKATSNKIIPLGLTTCIFCCFFASVTAVNCYGQYPGKRTRDHWKPNSQNEKGRNLILNGKINEAIASYAPLAQNSMNNTLIAEYAYALALSGIYDAALINLDHIKRPTNEQEVNYFTAQVFALMGYDDIANEFWKPSDNNIPAWIALNTAQLLEKYKNKLPKLKKTSNEELKAKFKRANELAAYHSYFQSIALFHQIIDLVPNEYLPYAGYSIPLEKIGALEASARSVEKAISLVGDHLQAAEKRQFLQHRLETIEARKAETIRNGPASEITKKLDANHPQMIAFAGASAAPSLTTLNFRIGYYLANQTNAAFNFGVSNTPGGSSVSLGLTAYCSIRSFVYGAGVQYSSAGYSSILYSAGLRMKFRKRKNRDNPLKAEVTSDLFLDINEGLSAGSPITWNLSYGTSFYFGKRKTR